MPAPVDIRGPQPAASSACPTKSLSLSMIVNSSDVLKFSDISAEGYIDLTHFVEDHGRNEDGKMYIEFLIPYEVMPIDQLDKDAYIRYKAAVRLPDPVIIKDPIGLFERQQVPPYYYLKLIEP